MHLIFSNVFVKLMLAFLAVVIMFYTWSNIMYKSGVYYTREEIVKNSIMGVANSLSLFEKDVENLRTIQNEYFVDKNVVQLSTSYSIMNPIEYSELVWNIQQRNNVVKSSNGYIKSIYVYVASVNRIICDNVNVIADTDDFPFDMKHTDDIMTSGSMIRYENNEILMVQTWPYHSKAPAIAVAFLLSREKIEAELSRYGNLEDVCALADDRGMYFLMSDDKFMPREEVGRVVAPIMKAKENGLAKCSVQGKPYDIVYVDSGNLRLKFIKFIELDRYSGSLLNIRLYYWLFAAFSLCIAAAFYILSQRLVKNPLRKLSEGLKEVETGNYGIRLETKSSADLKYIFEQFNNMAYKLKILIEQELKQRILVQEAQLKYLQAQINPHFLYNCFFTLYNMIAMEDIDSSKALSQYLGKYFKYIHNNEKDEVSLKDEVEHTKIYVYIQCMRFRGKIKINFGELHEEWGGVAVPRLLLQPILENIFEHGLKDKTSGGYAAVEYRASGGKLTIEVHDNGCGFDGKGLETMQGRLEAEEGEGRLSALVNIHRRLRIRFGSRSGIKVSNGRDGGAIILVIIDTGEDEADVQDTDRG